MIRVLSHRGYWKEPTEKNRPVAFDRSFALGFGTETDLRDRDGHLVVSHDPAGGDAVSAEDFFDQHARHDAGLTLALNVKADGLQKLLVPLLDRARDAFVFDMSVPDMLQWLKTDVPVFTRHSEHEPDPACYASSAGVWLDAFEGQWWGPDVVERHLDDGKRVCVVSPELHGRDPRECWDVLAGIRAAEPGALMLCTDDPEAARSVFGDQD